MKTFKFCIYTIIVIIVLWFIKPEPIPTETGWIMTIEMPLIFPALLVGFLFALFFIAIWGLIRGDK